MEFFSFNYPPRKSALCSQIMEGSTGNSKNVPKKSTSLGRLMGFWQYSVRPLCKPWSLQPVKLYANTWHVNCQNSHFYYHVFEHLKIDMINTNTEWMLIDILYVCLYFWLMRTSLFVVKEFLHLCVNHKSTCAPVYYWLNFYIFDSCAFSLFIPNDT